MAVQIQNNTDGTIASVSRENQLKVVSENHTLEHHISWHQENTYDVISVDTGITAQDQTVLHIINTSATKRCVLSHLRVTDLTTIVTHVIGNYFGLGMGRTISSVGTVATPVNLHRGSGKVAEVTVTGIDPVMAGSYTEIDRIHTVLGERVTYEFYDAVILDLNDTFEVKFISTGTGESKVSLAFMMVENAQ